MTTKQRGTSSNVRKDQRTKNKAYRIANTHGLRIAVFITSLLSLLFALSSCEQPGGITRDTTARMPVITGQPSNGEWHVKDRGTFPLEVEASSPDGNTLSFQWYGGDAAIPQGTDKTLDLEKLDYASDGTYLFYVEVTNTAGDGTSATAVSKTALVEVSGNEVILISSAADLAKIGVEGEYPLSGSYWLDTDLTLADWSPIGDDSRPFTGRFNGGGNKVTLESFADEALSGNAYLGIFGYVRGQSHLAKAGVKNLKVAATMTIDANVSLFGFVAAYAQMAELENITLSGELTYYGGGVVAGVVASASGMGTIIKGCRSEMNMYIYPGASQAIGAFSGSFAGGGIVGGLNGGVVIQDCHYRGDFLCDALATAGSQIFIGGILGSTPINAGSGPYNGIVADCSFIGTITGKGMGAWTWVGGIAGNMSGSNGGIRSRIERCYAVGTVSGEGSQSGWPYVGGIQAYNYAGSIISQCYFVGTVITNNPGSSDYAGGISAYNSQTSFIEDCWSDGEIRGFQNGGGIVGHNRVRSVVRRTYSLSKITVTAGANQSSNAAANGVGGISGNSPDSFVQNSVALNRSISAPNGFPKLNRIVAWITGAYNPDNNPLTDNISENGYAWSAMPVTVGGAQIAVMPGVNNPDGANCAEKPDISFYRDTLGWDFTTVWEMGADGYPLLRWQNGVTVRQ